MGMATRSVDHATTYPMYRSGHGGGLKHVLDARGLAAKLLGTRQAGEASLRVSSMSKHVSGQQHH